MGRGIPTEEPSFAAEGEEETVAIGEQETKSQYNSFQTKLLFSVFIFIINIAQGMSSDIMGTSLLDLQYLTGATTASITTAFTFRYAGQLLGSVLSGPVVDGVHEFVVFSMAMFFMGITTAVMPLWRYLPGLVITAFLGGIATGFNIVCITATIIKIWGKDVKPYQQMLHLHFSIGAAIAPQLIKPFLGPTLPLISNHSQQATNDSQNAEEIHAYLQSTDNSSHQVLLVNNMTNRITHLMTGTHILYGYLILAGCLWALSISSLAMFICCGCRFWNDYPKPDSTDEGYTETLITGKSKFLILFLFFLQCMLTGGIMEVTGMLLLVFIVKCLGWSKESGSNMTTVLFASVTISRIIGIILARYSKSSTLIAVQLGIILVGTATLTFAVHSHWAIPWIFFTVIGLGGGCLFATLVNWGQECMHLHGKETSVFLAGVGFAKMTFTSLIGYLFDHLGPMWFLYVMLTEVLIFIPCYITTVVLIHYQGHVKLRELVNERSELVPLLNIHSPKVSKG